MAPGGRVRGRAAPGAAANSLCQFGHRLLSSKSARLKDHWTLAQIPVTDQSARLWRRRIMNAGRWLGIKRPCGLAILSCWLLVTFAVNINAFGPDSKGKKGKADPAGAPSIDQEYTAKIKEYTTEPFFLTELVNYLPASSKVPSPEKVLGYVVGTPNKLTYTKDMYRYYRELEKATPRVRVLSAPELTEEGKQQLLVIVSDESNLARLDRYKDITAKLADPRGITDADAKQLIDEGKVFYWASGSIHSPETGSPEMLMELAYR